MCEWKEKKLTQKKEKNSRFLRAISMIVLLVTVVLCPQPSYADLKVQPKDPQLESKDLIGGDAGICPEGGVQLQKALDGKPAGIVKRVVYCTKLYIIPAVNSMLTGKDGFLTYFQEAIAAACTLAVAIYGVTVVTGKSTAVLREGAMVAAKIGAVMIATTNFGGSVYAGGGYQMMIDVTDELIEIVSTKIGFDDGPGGSKPVELCAEKLKPNDVWGRIDCMLESLVGGIFDPSTLKSGLAGFVLTSLFSGLGGVFVALATAGVMGLLIYAVIRAMYITIMAYIALGVMAMVSPLFITLMLFKSTFGYFEKWVKLTLGFMIQPLFIFAYFSMLLYAYDAVIENGDHSVYRAITGIQKGTPLPKGFQIGNWLNDSGAYIKGHSLVSGVSIDPKEQPALTNSKNLGAGGVMVVSPLNTGNAKGKAFDTAINDYLQDLNAYTVDLEIGQIDWDTLKATNPDAKSTKNYIIRLFLALMQAALTMYIFYLLLDMLPYIGSGIVGDSFSAPPLGAGALKGPAGDGAAKVKQLISSIGGGK